MNIIKIYTNYQILPTLQLHQMRVAAVAKIIMDNFETEFEDCNDVITADLLHDMGNIIKFNLTLYPEFLEPKGLDYWQNVQKEFIQKYGIDEHIATHKIAEEIGINERAAEILHAIGFSQSVENADHDDYAKKIATYADTRVGPYGIMSLMERINDGRKRFQKRINASDFQDKIDRFEEFAKGAEKIESQIFAKCRIKPEEITDEKVNTIIEQLKSFGIE